MEIIVLIIIISLLSLVLFWALRKMILSLEKDSKEYFMDKMQTINEEIIKKQKELDELNNNKKEKKEDECVVIKEQASIDKSLLNVINETDYETNNALKIASKVDEIFKIDEVKIIKDFLKNISDEDKENYELLMNMKDRFSPNMIYKLKMMNDNMQIDYLKKVFSNEEYDVFNSYLKRKKFKLNKFLLDLDLLIDKNKPIIEVYTGMKDKNYNDISPYIKTIYDENIYKGMIIKYQDSIYDYSINERDVG